jgi:hypothetical protein
MGYVRPILMMIAMTCLLQVTSATPEMLIQPSSSMVANGGTFTVDVKVGPLGEEVATAKYILQFDNTRLRAISQTPGTFLSLGGKETTIDKNEFDNTAGTVTYGEYITDLPNETYFGVYSPGTLASITFEAISDDGIGGLNITKPKLGVVFGRPDDPRIKPLNADDIDVFNGTYTISSYLRGDLDHNGVAADAADVAMMIDASVGDITPNPEYDLDGNDNNADAADVAMMIDASVGDITL